MTSSIGANELVHRLSESELQCLRESLFAAVNGPWITDDHEFRSRTGFSRSDASALLLTWPRSLASHIRLARAVLHEVNRGFTIPDEEWSRQFSYSRSKFVALQTKIDAAVPALGQPVATDEARELDQRSVSEFLDGLSYNRRIALQSVRYLILKHGSPLSEHTVKGGLAYHASTASGETPFLTLLPRDSHVSLLVHIGDTGLFRDARLGDEVKVSKKSVRIFRVTLILEQVLDKYVSSQNVEGLLAH
ncbi:MAG: hypothetical protein AAFZ38_11695 [Myxococcota bacterium]